MNQSGLMRGGPAVKSTGQSWTLATLDADGVKTSFTVPFVDTTYSGASLNGVLISNGALTRNGNITVALSNQAGGFTAGSTITIVGKHPYYDVQQREVLTIPGANGNVTLVGAKIFKAGEPLEITIEAQPNIATDGTLLIGVGEAVDVSPPANWVYVNAPGTLYVHLRNDPNERIVKVVCPVEGAYPISIDAIHASSTITDMWMAAEG